MIFAGDFAQLPPVGRSPLYSGVGTQTHDGLTVPQQEAALGKALWHQVTTVVILRENMRQDTQTPEDEALHTALVNMRYGSCTIQDIRFLRTRQAGKRPGQPNVASKEFRNVAIICGTTLLFLLPPPSSLGAPWESHFHCLVVTCGDHCTSSSPLVSYQTSPRHSLHLSVRLGGGIRGLVFSAPSNDEPHGDSKGAPIHASTLGVAALAHRWGVR
jgi:hypothetical protein